jgi:hypothetical protein
VHWVGKHLPIIAVLGGFLTVALLLPLGKALEIEGDEGFELNKAFLQSQGFKLYREIWDDQPPLYTSALTALFKIGGPSILGARLLTFGFSLLLLVALFGCVSHKFDRYTGWAAVALLATAPRYLSLSVSVMKEVPALSMALAAAWALFQWERKRSWQRLALSGALFGVALMIKFSAGLVLPAMLAEIFLATRPAAGRPRLFLRSLAVWLAGTLGMVVALAATLSFGGLSLLFGTHLSVQEIPGIPRPGDFPFPMTFFAIHADGYLCCAAALWVVSSRRLWRAAAFPLCQLTVTAAMHAWHRPWWNYYYLHLAIPVAWLGSVFAREAGQMVWNALAGRTRVRALTFIAGVLLAATGVQSVLRLAAAARVIRSSPAILNDPMVKHIGQYRDRTKWIYAQPIIYPFHARLRVPPELAVVTLKRYWSGQISSQEILACLRRRQPEQVLLFKAPLDSDWSGFLQAHYDVEFDDGKKVLYFAKPLKLKSPQ